MDLWEPIKLVDESAHIRIDPTDHLDNLSVLIGEILAIPQRFVVKHSVTNQADTMEPPGQFTAPAEASRHVGKHRSEQTRPKLLLVSAIK